MKHTAIASMLTVVAGACTLLALRGSTLASDGAPKTSRAAVASAHTRAVAEANAWAADFETAVGDATRGLRASVATVPSEGVASVAEMQAMVGGFVGNHTGAPQSVMLEDARCDGDLSDDCVARFEQELATEDGSLAFALAPTLDALRAEATSLRVTAWTVESSDGARHRALSIQGLRRGRVVGVVVTR